MSATKLSLPVFALALLMSAPAYANEAADKTSKEAPAPATEMRKGQDAKGNAKFQNDAYITISGTVASMSDGDEFALKHANGTIKVDTNDSFPDLFEEDAAEYLKVGDRVVVTGKVDNNLFSTNEIEAYRLETVRDGKNRVFTNAKLAPQNERDLAAFTPLAQGQALTDEKNVRLSGRISQIDGNDNLQLRFADGSIKVDLDDIDDKELSNFKVGDDVVVFGEVDKNWNDTKEIDAVRIVHTRSLSLLR